jgi:hypothetical protein
VPGITPAYDHIVVVVEENHSFTNVIGNAQAPYINSLANSGALLTNYHAITHPSQPNYFALYAGSTFGVDNAIYNEPGPTLASILQASGRTFLGYVDDGSPRRHNPWESFPEGFSVERNFTAFPSSNLSILPNVSFVIPNLDHDMHDGTIAQADQWLQNNLAGYAQWAPTHNSLLVVVWDEDDFQGNNQVPAILYGANVNPGPYTTSYNHYDLLNTLLAANHLQAPNNAASAAGIGNGVFVQPPIVGDGGNNTLTSTPENDTINGLGGDDTAVFSGALGSYLLKDFGNKITVSGPDGNDTLLSIEHLRFADGTINANDGSGLFDTILYDRNNLDVFHAGVNALSHYNTFGWHEGRDPDAFFSTKFYLGANQDVRAASVNPLDHYHQSGWKEGRDPSPNFDTALYLANNPDVRAAGVDPLEHYLLFGQSEGRAAYAAIGQTVAGFDAEYYLIHNPDVLAAGADPLLHYNTFGWHEGRNPDAYFDTAGYLAHYADVAAAGVNPLQHYEQFGWKEGRDPSAGFDTLGYLAANPDVASAHVNPLDHFLQFGVYEGRQVVNDGFWH